MMVQVLSKKLFVQNLILLIFLQLSGCSKHQNNLNSHNAQETITPTWFYECNGGNCQRTKSPLPTGLYANKIYPNLDLCRSACGSAGGIWPRPDVAIVSTYTEAIHPNFIRFEISGNPKETKELLKKMTRIALDNILLECNGNVTEVVNTDVLVHITVKSSNIVLSMHTNEGYSLDVINNGGISQIVAQIVAETVFGARHGLETFTQLISPNTPDFSNQKTCGLRLVTEATIKDQPVFGYRGLLLDTSRNFIPLEDIKRTIDGMAAAKLNMFHWHVTDSHSFPLESNRVPQFTRYGAYLPSEIYRVNEQKELIDYALARGVRVVIEIDAPAHAGNGWQWGKEYGFGDLAVCVNEEPWRKLCIEPPCGQLNVANPAMYRILRDLYRDIAEILSRPSLFHMGGDEVFIPCWNSSKEIVNFMTNQGYDLTTEGFFELWGEFHATALQIWDEELKAAGGEEQPVLLWSSELTQAHRIQKYLNKERYIIQVWEKVESPLLNQLINLGYQVISVPKNIWYLDHGFWGNTVYSNWRRMYGHMLPLGSNVLGGEVAMWSEYVDRQGLDTRVWPRAAAVAERLWSNPMSLASAAEPRLQRFRTRLIARGLRPDVISPGWCQQNDNRCL